MIITLINLLSEKINQFRRRNRNQPSYYRLFLFWLTLIILISAIFCILNNLGFENTNLVNNIKSIDNSKISNNIPISTSTDISNNIPSTGISNIISNKLNIEPNSSNLVATVSQQGVYDAPKTELYHEVLNQVGKIPKPLSFVDDFNYKL